MEASPVFINSVPGLQFIAAFNSQGTTILIIILLILLIFSFAVSGAEVAFFSLTYKDINLLKTKQQVGYKRIVDLLEEPKVLLASLVIANSFVNIAIIIICNMVMNELMHFDQLWVEFVIKVVVVTCLLVLFAEILPKLYATQNNIRFARDFGAVVEAVFYIFGRMGKGLVASSNVVEKLFASRKDRSYSLEELDHAIDITTNSTASDEEKNILKGIVKFSNITVKQIMKTRLDVSGVEYNVSFNTLIKRIEELHYSRVPVYKEDLDTMVGLVHTKDLLAYIDEPADFDWHTLIRPPYFVHEQKLIEDLLQEFQAKHIHFAIVVDEFGGTSGIVTLEDILEEIIGDIHDEFDDDALPYKKLDDNNFVFEGKMMINDVCKVMELPLDTFNAVKGESDSLAGLVLEIAGEIPQVNEVIPCGDFEFTILERLKNRLQKIKVTIKPQLTE
ncbi:MAG: gliding motility-associated protein GldE [Ilyomonas sp.]